MYSCPLLRSYRVLIALLSRPYCALVCFYRGVIWIIHASDCVIPQTDPSLHAGHDGLRPLVQVLGQRADVAGEWDRAQLLWGFLVDEPAVHQQLGQGGQNGKTSTDFLDTFVSINSLRYKKRKFIFYVELAWTKTQFSIKLTHSKTLFDGSDSGTSL